MDKRIVALLSASVLLLPSCRVFQQRIDFTWFSETMSDPVSDEVIVEVGNGLPASAIPADAEQAVPMASVQTVAPALVTAPPAKPAAGAGTHTVAQGDTLGGIARRYSCTVPALCQANGITNPNALKIGQVLNIPGGAAAPVKKQVAARPAARAKKTSWKFWKQNAPAAAKPRSYTVQKGDTLNGIAYRHKVTPRAIMQANGISADKANSLRIGLKLIIPAAR